MPDRGHFFRGYGQQVFSDLLPVPSLVHGLDHVNRRILRRLARQFKIHHLPFTVPNPENIAGVQVFFQAQKTPGNFCRQKSRALVSQLAVKIGIIFLESALKHQHVAKGREVQMLRTGTEKKLVQILLERDRKSVV